MGYLSSFLKGLFSLTFAGIALYYSFYLLDHYSSGIKGFVLEIVLLMFFLGLPFYIAEKLTFGKLGEAGTIILGLIILLAFAAFYKINSEKKLQEKYQKIGHLLGLKYEPEIKIPPQALANPLLNKGFMPSAQHGFKGKYGQAEILVFNYHYEELSSDVNDEYLRTAVVFSLNPAALPAFYLRPRTLSERIFKEKGIFFKEDKDFSKRYFLTGDEPDAVRKLFNPQVRKVLKEMKPDWAMAAKDGYLVIYADGKMDEAINAEYEALREYLDQTYLLFRVLTAAVK